MSRSNGSGGWYCAGTNRSPLSAYHSPMEFLDLFRELWHDFEEVSHDPVVRHLEDRRVLVLVDRDDDLGRAHAGEMLNRAGDAHRDVERRAYRLAGLSHLVRMWTPSRVDHGARRPHGGPPAERRRQLLQDLEVGGLLEPTTSGDDNGRLGHVEGPRGGSLDLLHDHPPRRSVHCCRLLRARLRPLHRREHVGTEREDRRSARNPDFEERLARVHWADGDDGTTSDAHVCDVLDQGPPEPGGDPRREILACGARREHDGAVAPRCRALGHRACVALGRVALERRIGQGDYTIRPESTQLLGAAHGSCRENQGVHRATSAERVGEPAGASYHLMGHLPKRTVALLEHREDVAHRTFASSRNRRTSSGTAAEPSPMILPACRSGGGVRARISSAPGPGPAGFTSRGFFLAAMIPLSAG